MARPPNPYPPHHPQPALSTAQRLVAKAASEYQAGRVDEAAQTARSALTRGAADADSLRTIASIMGAAGLKEQSLFTFERALKLRPDDWFTLEEYGKQLATCQKNLPAIAALTRSIELNPRVNRAFVMALTLLEANGHDDEAARLAAIPLARARSWPEAMACVQAAGFVGSSARVRDRFDRMERLLGPHPAILTARLQRLLYAEGLSEDDIFRAHAAAGQALARVFPAWTTPWPHTLDPERPLRVGYVSQDFRDRSAGHFIEGIITGHTRSAFTPFCYHHTLSEDSLTARLRGASTWRDIRAADDEAVARTVREDRIDIFVDLTGHTGLGRLAPFAFRPAPVQITYMGYPHTTGLPTIDARIVDSFTDPPGAERFATERLIRHDPCFLCYTPPTHAPPVAARSPFSTGVVFGSFNSAAKLTDRVLRLWARILREVPGSRLLLKAAAMDSPGAFEHVASALSEEGVDPSRCTLHGETKGLGEHLSAYAGIDIALDPFPYNGTTTTLEALWMGVPVVVLAGNSHRGRVGLSLLTNLGLSALVAANEEEYVGLAKALAGDATRRAALRDSLRAILRDSPICDKAGFVARLEAAYRALWVRFCASGSARATPRS